MTPRRSVPNGGTSFHHSEHRARSASPSRTTTDASGACAAIVSAESAGHTDGASCDASSPGAMSRASGVSVMTRLRGLRERDQSHGGRREPDERLARPRVIRTRPPADMWNHEREDDPRDEKWDDRQEGGKHRRSRQPDDDDVRHEERRPRNQCARGNPLDRGVGPPKVAIPGDADEAEVRGVGERVGVVQLRALEHDREEQPEDTCRRYREDGGDVVRSVAKLRAAWPEHRIRREQHARRDEPAPSTGGPGHVANEDAGAEGEVIERSSPAKEEYEHEQPERREEPREQGGLVQPEVGPKQKETAERNEQVIQPAPCDGLEQHNEYPEREPDEDHLVARDCRDEQRTARCEKGDDEERNRTLDSLLRTGRSVCVPAVGDPDDCGNGVSERERQHRHGVQDPMPLREEEESRRRDREVEVTG